MKTILLSLSLVCCFFFSSQAQDAVAEGEMPVFEFIETRHNFGQIEEGTQASHDFVFKNTGKTPLIITNVRTSCGCTSPFWPREPIMPGEESKITAVYNSRNRMGSFNKTITVESNTTPSLTNLKISGEVIKPNPEETMPFKEQSILSPERK